MATPTIKSQHFLTIRDLAEILGISVATLYRWRAEGVDLPPAIELGSRLRWRRESVDAWAAAKEEL